MLGAAVEIAARGNAFAARQVDAALVAAHHVLAGAALRWPAAPAGFARGFKYPVGQQQCQEDDEEFCQAFAPVGKSRKFAASDAARRVLARVPTTSIIPGIKKWEVVGARGFEPPTPASRTQYSTRLSYAPTWLRRFPGSTAGMLDFGRGILATESTSKPSAEEPKRVQSITGARSCLNASGHRPLQGMYQFESK